MRTIIAGSRNFNNYKFLLKVINKSKFNITKVISGGARGVDKLGEIFADKNKIDKEIFPADWKLLGKRAGYIRNEKMAINADALIAIVVNRSRGTSNMIEIARNKGLKIFIAYIDINIKTEEF